MDTSQVKLIVSDMDGTLLNSQHEVSPLFFQQFTALQAKGIHFVAASGRQYHSIVDKLAPIKDHIYVIAENGAIVKHREEELLCTPLARETVLKLLDVVAPIPNAHAVLCGKEHAFVHGGSQDFITLLKEYYTEFEVLDNLQDYTGEILKIAVYHHESSEAHILPAVAHLEDQLKVKVSGQNWLDLSHPNAHKGYALERLQHQLGIGKAQTMVFGDYNNDLEMLGLAEHSYAMANAHPNVLKAANFKTATNDENGVEQIIGQVLTVV